MVRGRFRRNGYEMGFRERARERWVGIWVLEGGHEGCFVEWVVDV